MGLELALVPVTKAELMVIRRVNQFEYFGHQVGLQVRRARAAGENCVGGQAALLVPCRIRVESEK